MDQFAAVFPIQVGISDQLKGGSGQSCEVAGGVSVWIFAGSSGGLLLNRPGFDDCSGYWVTASKAVGI
jgi:hypothetical protein